MSIGYVGAVTTNRTHIRSMAFTSDCLTMTGIHYSNDGPQNDDPPGDMHPPSQTGHTQDPDLEQTQNPESSPTTSRSQDATGPTDSQSRTQPDLSEWHEIEKLMACANYCGKKYYKVCWVNRQKGTTWKLAENISDNLKHEFHIKKTTTGRSRKRPQPSQSDQ